MLSPGMEAQIQDFDPLRGKYRGKILLAASEKDSTVLEEILLVASTLPYEDNRHDWFTDYWDGNGLPVELLECVIRTPLLEAIDHGRAKNVRLLLEAGVDPQGINEDFLHRRMVEYRVHDQLGYLPPFDAEQTFTVKWQNARIGEALGAWVNDRTRTVFTTVLDSEPEESFDLKRHDQTLHSLIRAAMVGSMEIFYLLFEGVADASYWLEPSLFQNIDRVPISATSLSTPLHAAARGGHIKMLQVLLGLGFDPNCMPLAAGPLGQTPIQSCFSVPLPHLDGFRILASHPRIDFSIVSSIHKVHLFHFVVAHLDLAILKELLLRGVAPTSVDPTSVGHTLLHIACLPRIWLDIQYFSDKVFTSIHETRFCETGPTFFSLLPSFRCSATPDEQPTLDKPPLPNVDGPGFSETFDGSGPFLGVPVEHRRFLPDGHPISAPLADYTKAQTETVQWLLSHGVTDITAQDVHGNTVMHYLASHRKVNNELVAYLRRNTEHGNHVWLNNENCHGWTPAQLWHDSMVATEEFAGKHFWMSRVYRAS